MPLPTGDRDGWGEHDSGVSSLREGCSGSTSGGCWTVDPAQITEFLRQQSPQLRVWVWHVGLVSARVKWAW